LLEHQQNKSEEKMKTKILIIVSLLAVLVLSACSGGKSDYPNTMSASGQGIVYVTPDVAYINIGVTSKSENVATALEANTRDSQAVADTLKELGVDAKDIQTSAFNIYPQPEYGPDGQITRTMYQVDNTLYVTVRDLNSLPKMLNAVVQSGANQIYGITFDVLDKSAAISEARKMAIEDAKKNAAEIASAAGIQLGKLMGVNVYDTSGPTPMYEGKYALGGGGMAASNVPVSAGQLIVAVNADLAFEIK
jgi:hypothetical protein